MSDDTLSQERLTQIAEISTAPPGVGRWRTAPRAGKQSLGKHELERTFLPRRRSLIPVMMATAATIVTSAVFVLVSAHVFGQPTPPRSAIATVPRPSGSAGSNGATTHTPGPSPSIAPSVSPGTSAAPAVVHPGSTAAPTPQKASINCISQPSACGYPDASNTGVPAGTSLTPVESATLPSGSSWNNSNGTLTVSANGTTIQNISIADGGIRIDANNVTVKNVSVASSGPDFAVYIVSGHTGTIIENSTIHGINQGGQSVQDAVQDNTNGGTVMRQLNLYNCSECVYTSGTLEDSYVHDVTPSASTQDVDGSGPLTVIHNTLLNQTSTEAVVFCPANSHCTITDNLLAGGAYTIYGGESSGGADVITNNRFSPTFFSSCGAQGYITNYTWGSPNNVWSGNVWDNTNQGI